MCLPYPFIRFRTSLFFSRRRIRAKVREDITEQLKAEKQLERACRTNEMQARQIVNAAPTLNH